MINKKYINQVLVLLLLSSVVSFAQIREYQIHQRGMLHETVFNTGEIGRAWAYGAAGYESAVPLMEWPARSSILMPGNKRVGQHNIIGGGIYIAANLLGKPGTAAREYAFCGGVGGSTPEVAFGRWSFPISIERIENFPVLDNGKLNPNYNPDEAEEIIKSKWSTNLGITVTRTSRAWSYPDYDDMIIYEYEFENTGDKDGNLETIERDSTLNDILICFNYGIAPSMYGYIRHYNEWKYEAAMYRGDQRKGWDYEYWLSFNMDLMTKLDSNLAAKPEPNDTLFMQYSKSGERGGGLASPQSPGYCFLYYDKDRLSIMDPFDSTRNESEGTALLQTSSGEYFEIDENYKMLQPWRQRTQSGVASSSKLMVGQGMNMNERSNPYKPTSQTWPWTPPGWLGRSAFTYRQADDAISHYVIFGPYKLKKGEKTKFALAEVVGYGAKSGKIVEGIGKVVQRNEIPTMDKRVVLNGKEMTKNYLRDFGYPDYVNSKRVWKKISATDSILVPIVADVQDVAANAWRAYTGIDSLKLPLFPDRSPSKGVYKIPVPFPAPAIALANTSDGNVIIKWSRDVEGFTHPRLMGALSKFNIYRANAGMGPWKKIATINKGQAINQDGVYEFRDQDSTFRVGESRFYAVTSEDVNGNESGKTNIINFKKNIGSVEKMNKIYVVPNPFNGSSGYQGSGDRIDDKIGFYGLPTTCTIRIFSYSGQLVHTIEHDTPLYSTEWLQVSKNGQDIASGMYFYVVTTPQGDKYTGKFVIIK